MKVKATSGPLGQNSDTVPLKQYFFYKLPLRLLKTFRV